MNPFLNTRALRFFFGVTFLIISGCSMGEHAGTQVLAQVNGEEITVAEVDQYLETHPMAVDSAQQAQRMAIDAVIDQHLLQDAARDAGVDREADVMLALLQARKETLIHAYESTLAVSDAPATAADISHYYMSHPLLYADRRDYGIDVLLIQADSTLQQALLKQLGASPRYEDFKQWVMQQRLPNSNWKSVLEPENMSSDQLATFSKMAVGAVYVAHQDEHRIALWELERLTPNAIPLDRARVQIMGVLAGQARADAVAKTLRTLRAKAKISYYQQ